MTDATPNAAVSTEELSEMIQQGGTGNKPNRRPGGGKNVKTKVAADGSQHSIKAVKKILPPQARLLVCKTGDNGKVRPIDRYSVEDVIPDGDIEGFVLHHLVPKFGAGEYPIFLIEKNGDRTHWTTIGFARPKETKNTPAGTIDPNEVVNMTKDAREEGIRSEQEKFTQIREAENNVRSQFSDEIGLLRRQVLEGSKNPQDAMVTLKTIEYLQNSAKGASDDVVTLLMGQVEKLQDQVANPPKREDGSENEMMKMMMMQQLISETNSGMRSIHQSQPVAAPAEIGPQTSPVEDFRGMMEIMGSMMKNMMPQQQAPAMNHDLLLQELGLMMERKQLKTEKKLIMIEAKLAENNGGKKNDLDDTLTTMRKLREAIPEIAGEQGASTAELIAGIVEHAPATIEAMGEAWERKAMATANAHAIAGHSKPSKRPPAKQQAQVRKTATEAAGKVTQKDKAILRKFAKALAMAANDNDIFDAVSFFVIKMHGHPMFGPYVHAIIETGGSDRQSYMDQIVENFFAGKAPDGMSEKICAVIKAHESELRAWLKGHSGDEEGDEDEDEDDFEEVDEEIETE